MILTIKKEVQHVAIYLRISREKKNENRETLENHLQLLLEIVNQFDWTYEIIGEVLSAGVSEIEKRPKLHELLEKIEQFDAILCYEITRLSRNGLISQLVKQTCKDYDIPIITPTKIFDLSNSEQDRLHYDISSSFSSYEFDLIGKRSKMNKIQMAKAGLHVSGLAPFGYKRNKETKKLEIDEEEAQTVRFVYKLRLQGVSHYKIRDILNEEGYKTATNRHFNVNTIKRILRNPVYKGWIVFQDRKEIKKQDKKCYEINRTITTKKAHEPIILEKDWETVNKLELDIKERTRVKPTINSNVTMLKDLIYCGCCGRKMTIRKDKKLNAFFIKKCEYLQHDGRSCSNIGIKLELVEEQVILELNRYEKEIEIQIAKMNFEKEEQSQSLLIKQITNIGKRLLDLELQNNKLIDLAIQNIFTHEEIMKKKEELSSSINSLLERKLSLNAMLEKPPYEHLRERVVDIVASIHQLKQLNLEKANETLTTFIKKITYTRVLPEDLRKKSTRNKERQLYPFQIEIDYL